MPVEVQISTPTLFGGRKTYRRDLPTDWGEVVPARRLRVLQALTGTPGLSGRIEALKVLLDLPNRVFLGLSDLDISGLLLKLSWLDLAPTAQPMLLCFEHDGRMYHAPKSHGLNLVALEYPIADEAFGNFMRTADLDALRLLIGTLYRERNPDQAEAERRGDVRVALSSRWEAEARAERLKGVKSEVAIAAMLYFAGVKLFVHRSYGKALFQDENEAGSGDGSAGESNTANPIGWWGVYFNVAQEGPFGRNVEEVYQTSFHDVCLYLADRKRQQHRMLMQQRLQSNDFGIDQPD